MKNHVRCGLFFVSALVGALAASSARAAVLWTATLEKGDLSEWMGGPNPTKMLSDGTVRKNVEVVGEKVNTGKFACKITLHPDDTYGQYNQDRVDIKHESTLTGEGKDSYLSGYYYLPEDAKTRMEIGFYETKVTSRNWMDLWVEPKTGGGTTVKFGIESNGADLGSVLLWTGEWKAAQWHQFAIHVHWSTDATKGIVDVWFDGQPVIANVKHKTKFDGNDLYYETGLHRVLPKNFTEVIYFDDFIEADTLAEIKVATPTTPTDAGPSDTASPGTGGTIASDAAISDTAPTGTGGATGTGGTPGSGGTTGNPGTGGANPTGTGGAPSVSSPDSPSGCSCQTTVPTPTTFLPLLFIAALLRRRRP